MSWLALIAVLFLILIPIILWFGLADADLTLLFKAKYGIDPASLQGQVVWITGSSSGIGEYLAYELAKVGCRLVLSARREDELLRVQKQCLLVGNSVREDDIMVLPLDVADTDSHQGAVAKVIDRFKQIDILVNNAGRSQRAWILETSIEVDKEMININVLGQISLTKAVLPHMVARHSGHVVVTSSLAGKIGIPFSATYCLTKFALHGWFESLRIEGHQHNIKVTMVCPGPVFSDLTKACFTGEKDKVLNQPMQPTEKRVTTARCGQLMLVAIANKMDEVWISLHPPLAFIYLAQYLPSISRKVLPIIGLKAMNKMREGKL